MTVEELIEILKTYPPERKVATNKNSVYVSPSEPGIYVISAIAQGGGVFTTNTISSTNDNIPLEYILLIGD